MRTLRLLFSLVVALLCVDASAQDLPAFCAREHFAQLKKEGRAFGIVPSEAESMVADVARSISFEQNIQVILCSKVRAALSWPAKGEKDMLDTDFIIINPMWFQEVIGTDRTQAITLIGHELGHYTGRHFESRSAIPREQKETEADHFAGCAVARMDGDINGMINLLGRLRSEMGGGGYPSRAKSIEAARSGFNSCGGGRSHNAMKQALLRVVPRPDTVAMTVNGYMAVDYEFKEMKGIDADVESEDTQWFFLDGTPITRIERFGRILDGAFRVSASSSHTYHNNIYLRPDVVDAVRKKGENAVVLRHLFNYRDTNEQVSQALAILKVYIQ